MFFVQDTSLCYNIQDPVDAYAQGAHCTNDAESHDVAWSIVTRKEVRAIDLCQIAHSVDERQTHSSRLPAHTPEVEDAKDRESALVDHRPAVMKTRRT